MAVQRRELPLFNVSNLFVAPNEKMAIHYLSSSSLETPTSPICPKIEVKKFEVINTNVLHYANKLKILKQLNDENFIHWKKQKRAERKALQKKKQTEPRSVTFALVSETEVTSNHIGSKEFKFPFSKYPKIQKSRKFKSKIQTIPIWESWPYKNVLSHFDWKPIEKMSNQTLLPNLILDACLNPDTSLVDTITNFSLDAYSKMKDITIETFLKLMSELKPMTLSLIIRDYLAADTQREKFAILCCLWEFNDVFWTENMSTWKTVIITALVKIVDWIFVQCWPSVRDLTGESIPEHMENQDFSLKEDGLIKKILSKFNIDLSEYNLSQESSFMFTCVCTLVAIVTGGSLTGICEFSLKKILKRMNQCSTSLKSCSNIMEYLPKVWDNTLSIVGDLLGFSHTTKDQAVQDLANEIITLKSQAHELSIVIQHRPWELLMSPEILQNISSKYEELDKIYMKLMMLDKNMAAAKPALDELKDIVKSLTEYSESLKHGTVVKQEPWLLFVAGKPGIGKSAMISKLCEDVSKEVNIPNTSYPRNSVIKHWDDYSGQSFIIYDDFGSQKTDLDHADIMQYKNPNKTMLTMAKLNEKGRYFSTTGVIACANTEDIESSATVKTPEALKRRLEMFIEVFDPNMTDFLHKHGTSPGDYQKTHGQIPMIEDEDGEMIPYYDPENFEHLTILRRPHYLNPDASPEPITYKQLVKLIAGYYNYYHEAFIKTLRNNDKILSVKVNNPYEVKTHDRMMAIYNSTPQPENPQEEENFDEELLNDLASTASSGRRKKVDIEALIKDRFSKEAIELRAKNLKKTLKDKAGRGEISSEDYAEASVSKNLAFTTKIINIKHTKHTDKRTFIDNYLRENTKSSRAEAERKYRQSHFMECQTTPSDIADSFISVKRGKGTIFLLSGAPGTGKSTFQSVIEFFTKAPFVSNEDLLRLSPQEAHLIVEDPTITAETFNVFTKLVNAVYDNQSVVKVLLASINPEIMNSYWKNNEEKERFMRRCVHINFAFHKKKSNMFKPDEYFTSADVERQVQPYCNMVKITSNIEGPFQNYTDTHLQRIINEAFAETKEVILPLNVCVPYVNRSSYVPEFVIEFKSSMEEAFEKYFHTPKSMVSDLLTGQVSLKKGGIAAGVSIASQFALPSSGIQWPGNLDEFIKVVNNSKYTSERDFVTEIQANDCTLVIIPQKSPPNRILMFKVDEDVSFQENFNTVTSNEETEFLGDTTRHIYNDVFAQRTAVKLETTITNTVDSWMQNLNISKIFTEFPCFEKITGCLIFMFKLFLAGTTIFTLFDTMKISRFPTEAKGKNKSGRGARKIKPTRVHLSPVMYDDFRDVIDRHCTSAKRMRVSTAVDMYVNLNGDDALEDLDVDVFEKFIIRYMNYGETREEKTVLAKPPVVTLTDPYVIEDKIKLLTPKPQQDFNHKPSQDAAFVNEALLDPSIRTNIDLACNQTVDIYSGPNGENYRCHGLMIHGRIGVTVGHIYEKDVPIWIKTFKGIQAQKFKATPLKHYSALDILIFKVESKSFPEYRNIIAHLPPRKADIIKSVVNRAALLVIPDKEDGTKFVQNVHLISTEQVLTETGKCDGVTYQAPITYMPSFQTRGPINTQGGDCGGVVIINDSGIQQKFIGIHNAGNTDRAHASFLYSDLFTEYMNLESTNPSKVIVNPHHDLEIRELTRESLLGMPIAGEGNLKIFRPKTTNLWTSPLALPESKTYQPSIIDPFDNRNTTNEDPFYRSVAKWNHPQPDMNMKVLDRAVTDIGYWYAMEIKKKNIETKVLTKTEAINSGKNYNVMPINRKSAAGYPWCRFGKKQKFLVNKGSGNEAYYGIDLTTVAGRKLNGSIDYLIEQNRIPNQHVAIPFCGWLKDEPVKMNKIYDVNTRSFAGAPFDYTIAFRMYFSTIYGAIHQVRDKMPIQVGINPTSMEWDFMVRRLLAVSNDGFDLDFKGFDSSVPAVVQERIVLIKNKIAQLNDPNWTHEDDIIRINLHKALVKPLIVCPTEEHVYILQAPGGQISGHPGTADDNSLIHLVYLYYSWLILMETAGLFHLCNLSSFISYVAAIIYGDDGAYTVHLSVQHIFNFSSVQKVLSNIGIECTPAAKIKGISPNIIKLKDFEFLKRDFVKKGSYWFGALKKLSFEKMLGFCLGPAHFWHKAQSTVYCERRSDLVATCQAALWEAAIHGREFYEQMSAHCFDQTRKLSIDWIPPQYADVVSMLDLPLPL